MSEIGTHEPCPGAAGDAGEKSPRACSWGDLPEHLRGALSTISKDQWPEVIVTLCPSEIIKDATAMVATFARVWEKSRPAEDFRDHPLTGEERAQFRRDLKKALEDLAAITIKLGVRARLYGELQQARLLLLRYNQNCWQNTWKKSMARNVGAESAPRPATGAGAKPAPNPARPPRTPERPDGAKKLPAPQTAPVAV